MHLDLRAYVFVYVFNVQLPSILAHIRFHIALPIA